MGALYRGLYQVAKLYWRIRRPLTMGVRVAVVEDDHVFLVRQSYLPGWYLPGGGVERGETTRDAACRELHEEAGFIVAPDNLQLVGLYANFADFKNDHVALYRATSWTPGKPTASRMEITDRQFFPIRDLPPDVSRGTRERIREVIEGVVPSPLW